MSRAHRGKVFDLEHIILVIFASIFIQIFSKNANNQEKGKDRFGHQILIKLDDYFLCLCFLSIVRRKAKNVKFARVLAEIRTF